MKLCGYTNTDYHTNNRDEKKMVYEYLDTITGDAEFVVRSETLGGLLAEAGKALVGLMYNLEKIEPVKTLEITVKGEDPEELLYNWLSEILFIQDTENVFFKDFNVNISETKRSIVATGLGRGQPGDPSLVEAYVKAISLHNFYVKKTNVGWEARVTVDL